MAAVPGEQANPKSVIDYRIKFMRRKTVGLYLLPGGVVEVRAPRRTSKKYINDFVQQHSDWLQERLEVQDLRVGEDFLVFGRPRKVVVVIAEARRIVLRAETLTVYLLAGDDDESLRRYLQSWMLTVAKRHLPRRLTLKAHWCRQLQVTEPALKLRYMRSRWGSCSAAGHINLSTALIQLPVAYADYVIAHELTHLRVFDHSVRFYQWMEQLLPEWRSMRKGIRQYSTGVELMQVSHYLHQ
ncbi:hypothetical protein EDC56_0278 [Sinobacterium caligoides]|uniref:YgjP-like metallopeptidase domain-containing protein n=1 Tax=Sinobacterium caligoides TaxID=933926 RepID=A0A3N2DZN2_9GAMM|nr:SprT family zinc-dependent metalloprotease [Sinobacterium caligoides]ROS04765.1 hypothetical protein EDC56_0278 [Sinobacterium caligoides]